MFERELLIDEAHAGVVSTQAKLSEKMDHWFVELKNWLEFLVCAKLLKRDYGIFVNRNEHLVLFELKSVRNYPLQVPWWTASCFYICWRVHLRSVADWMQLWLHEKCKELKGDEETCLRWSNKGNFYLGCLVWANSKHFSMSFSLFFSNSRELSSNKRYNRVDTASTNFSSGFESCGCHRNIWPTWSTKISISEKTNKLFLS